MSPPRRPGPDASPRLGTAEVAVLDELDKVHPVTGALIPAAARRAIWKANHLWVANGARRGITLHSASQ